MTTPSSAAALLELANSLDAEGRKQHASLLLEHLGSVYPKDAAILRRLAKMLAGQGRTIEAIEALCRLKPLMEDKAALLEDIREQMNPAIESFNKHLAAGEVAKAEQYAAALTTVLPGNAMLLKAAMSCNLSLGRKEKAATYAEALLAIDATNAAARALVGETAKRSPSLGAPPTPRPAAALMSASGHTAAPPPPQPEPPPPAPPSDVHPLIQLRDKHDTASRILCAPLTGHGLEEVEQLLNAARGIAVSVPSGSDLEAWAKHYRVMVDAIDVQSLKAPAPDLARDVSVDLASSSGAPLTWKALRELASRQKAKVAFFAAADRVYVDLYARWYVKSVLKNSDVPCLVVLHVVGGSGQLRDIAQSLNIRDQRLVLSGDRFDAAAVTTKCYDAPPKGLIAKPVAHLQSARFLIAGAFLRNLKLPVFISDIDCLLQRGVDDLLKRSANADVVLNENTDNTQAGSRFTANLVLLNPTSNAALFLCYLRSYLEDHLNRAEVSRWIDQFGLLLARHYLAIHGKDAHIEYFDTKLDINNVMYPSFQQNPFRFLSLYHGFDMSSLERADALGGAVEAEPKRPKKATAKKRPAAAKATPAKEVASRDRKKARNRSAATA